MGEDRQTRILRIVTIARDQPEPQRETFLDVECGDDVELRSQVSHLLSPRNTIVALRAPEPTQVTSPEYRGGGEDSSEGGDAGHAISIGPGSCVGPYLVEAQIGAGGMGVVFKARDTRLDRDVALKLLRSPSGDPQLQAAIVREARLASSLNHPGIVTIYDILAIGDLTCIVMEFVRGVPLHQLIPEQGLPLDRAFSIARGIGEAIAAAHAAGIVHRDLKPANILVRSDDKVKILDFGVARMTATASRDNNTEPHSIFFGSRVGTVGYMPPEQARGQQVDVRADIFAFGVILYRMLTGVMPFHGATAVDVMREMQAHEPAPMRTLRPEIPPAVETVVRRALAWAAADRYQTIRELLNHLSEPAAKTPPASGQPFERTIAVLPLINISPEPENEYLCDGLAEELIDGLTQIGGLRVVSRSSSFQFKGTTPDVREIGQRLGARLLVHGSLRRSSGNIRLNMQLIQTSDGYQVWSKRFDARAQDLFTLQDELTGAVLEELRQQLGARFSALDIVQDAPSPEAYDLFLRARYAFNRETPAGFREAQDLFRSAAAADPKFAPAWIGMAETHMRLEWYGLEPASEAVPAVKSELAAALRLRPDSVVAFCDLAVTQAGWDWDWAASGESFQRALGAGQELAMVHFHYGLDYLTPQCQLEEALEEIRLAAQLDPLSAIVNTAIGGCLYRTHRYEDAAKTLAATLRATPGFGHAHWSLGRVLIEQGLWDEAMQHFDRAAEIMGHSPAALTERAYCHARMGRHDLARTAIQELQRRAEHEWVSPVGEALVYAGLGEDDAAMDRLEIAFGKRMRQLVWVNVDPRFASLRNNPGFRSLISRIGLPAQP
ncbi:MAG TPA: protein kinase [Silvibacterium sp.]|nr:protein kinase [Silvibacterium sp.]